MSAREPETDALDALLRRMGAQDSHGLPVQPTAPANEDALAERIAARVLAARGQGPKQGSQRHRLPAQSGTWASAACLVLLVALGATTPSAPRLPPFELEVHGQDRIQRSTTPVETSSSLKVSRGGRLRLVARPSERVDGAVTASLWRFDEGVPVRTERAIAVSAAGAAQLDAPIEALLSTERGGPQRLWLVLSPEHAQRIRPQALVNARAPGRLGDHYVFPIVLELKTP